MYSCAKFESNRRTLIFHFFMGSPLCKSFDFFLHWHFMMKRLKFKGGTPWKSEKWRVSDLTQILHSCTKCNFMHIAKISATFVIENFTTSTNNRSVNIQVLPFCSDNFKNTDFFLMSYFCWSFLTPMFVWRWVKTEKKFFCVFHYIS